MTQEHADAPIRVVIAAPFKELVDLHERASEYADELDVCGVISNPGSVVDQARVLQPDVLILSVELGTDPADVLARLATDAPTTRLVMLVGDRDAAPRGGATALRLDATGSELRAAVMVAAGRLRGHTAPAAHAGAGAGSAPPTRWFWENDGPEGAGATPASAEPPTAPVTAAIPDSLSAAAEASAWPPPWLHIDADDEDRFALSTTPPRPVEPSAGIDAVAPAAATGAPPAPAPISPPSEFAEVARTPLPMPTPTPAPVETQVPPDTVSPASPPATAERDGKHWGRGWIKRGVPPASAADAPLLFDVAFPAAPVALPAPALPADDVPPPAAPSRPHDEGGDPPSSPRPQPPAAWVTRAPREDAPVPVIVPEEVAAPAPAPAPAPAAVPALAPAAVPAVLSEPVPEPAEPEEPIVEQPKTRTRRPGRTRAETILVFSGKGGVGKSVVATNLAVALSARDAKVALIDLNLQYGDIGVLLHLETHPTSIELLAQQGDQVDPDYLEEVMATGPESLRVLLAPASPEFADLVTATSLRSVLRELSRSYDFVVVDAPAHLEERVLEVIEVADQILVVSSFNITSVKDTRVTLRLLQSLGVERDHIAVVLNQTQPKVGFTKVDIEKSMRYEVLAQLPHDAHVDDTVDSGRPMVLDHPKSDFAKQFRTVVDFIVAADDDQPAAAPQEEARPRPARKRLFGR